MLKQNNSSMADIAKRVALQQYNPLEEHSSKERRERVELTLKTINDIAKRSPENESVQVLRELSMQIVNTGLPSLAPLLPALLTLKGKPYNLNRHFPFEPFFNTFMPRNLVLKTGRQVSKCGRADSNVNAVYDSYGKRYRLCDIEPGQLVQALNTDTFKSCVQRVLYRHENPIQTCYYIRTRRGVEMELAYTHPLLTYAGWTAVADLDVGTRIAHVNTGGQFGNKYVDNDRIRITAYMLGDGSFRGSYNFTAKRSSEALAEMRLLLRDYREYPKANSKANMLVLRRTHELHTWAREDNLHGKLSYEKVIPAWVFLLSKNDTRTFIERLWSTDGMIKLDKRKAAITYTSTSRELIYDLKSLLLKFGIPTCVKQRRGAYKKANGLRVDCRHYWILRVETRQGWQTFLDEFTVPDKPAIVLPTVNSSNNRYTVPIEIGELIAELAGECRGINSGSSDITTLATRKLRKKLKYPVSAGKLQEYLSFFKEHRANHPKLLEFSKYIEGHVDWDEIVEIRNIGKHKCVDLEIENTHNYLLDGIVSHNSTSLAAQGVVISNCIPYFNTLYVTPLFEMIRRFSGNYVRGFIEESPVKNLWTSSTTSSNVLQRSFNNKSNMFFSYAFLDADRTRGLNCNKCSFDEIQDLDETFIPIIRETMSGSPYGDISQYAGTPKTLDNTLEKLWIRSSQAEWMITCERCNYDNVPALSHDLVEMIGPWSDDIGPSRPGTICANPTCRLPIDPRQGYWVHRYPERQANFAGYHVPQIIMPMHYADKDKWQILVGKKEGLFGTPLNVFYNEVCGESFDTGSKLVTLSELQAAAVLHKNTLSEALAVDTNKYFRKILAVDWGGGGEEETSYTTYAVLGMLPTGQIHCIYGHRSLVPHDFKAEARICLDLVGKFNCSHIVHDYNGAGAYREKYIIDSGFPYERVIPVQYVPAATQDIMYFIEPSDKHPRARYHIDKARSLVLTCQQIKDQQILFFQYDHIGAENTGLLHDFLALVEDKVTSKTSRDIYKIIRQQNMTDDFAQAVNMGCCALWYMTKSWPDTSAVDRYRISDDVIRAMSPNASDQDWDDI
jgi:hypothetical protein